MNIVSLGELIWPAGSRAGRDASLPVFSVTKHAGFVRSAEYFKKQVFSRDTAGYKVVEAGQFAYATIHLDEGSIGIAPQACIISPMYTVFANDPARVDSRYLVRYLKSPRALEHYGRMGNGAVHRRKAISLDALSNLPVPLPPLKEQHRVAAALDAADSARVARAQSLASWKAVEDVLFAEVASRATRSASLAELGVDFTAGRNLVAEPGDEHQVNRVIKVSAISSASFRACESKPLPANYSPPDGHKLQEGDVLFGRASGSVDLIGVTAVVDSDAQNLYLPDKVWRVNMGSDSTVSAAWILGVLRSPEARAYFRHNASGAAGVRNIAKDKVRALSAPIPPKEDQDEFAARVAKIDEQRALVQRALDLDNELFASLQHRAFSGML